MSNTEKPLHVRVAEALGWKATRPPRPHETHGQWVGQAPARGHWGADIVPHFDSSWKHAAPLIEKYKLSLLPCSDGDWLAITGLFYGYSFPNVDGESSYCIDVYGVEGQRAKEPLLAVCNLILAAAGKL